MIDREKVLQALEHCDLCSDMPNCPGCAYLREPDCMEHLKRDIIALLKAQEPEALDAPKPDSDIGCWYDITHNYTLEQVVSALKSRELCEDAVSRKYLLGQSYSISFQTIDESDEEAYREKVVCVEDIEDAPSVQPVPIARVMTWEEAQANVNEGPFVIMEVRDSTGTEIDFGVLVGDSYEMSEGSLLTVCNFWMLEGDYGKRFRCWTSRPTDKQREAIPWEKS